MKIRIILFLFMLLPFGAAFAQNKPSLPEIDRIRIAEAFRIGRTLGNKVWQDWDKAPFAVLLVTPENEFLIRHPKPSADFVSIGYDSLLKSDVYSRQRIFNPNLLATFPAVGGISTIVIGQAENTAKKNSTDWVITMLHEHFHQLQNSQPGYYADVTALNLSGGDTTGMWMLNYAFPYSDPKIKEQFIIVGKLLAEAVQAKPKKKFSARLAHYLEARRKLEAMLKPADYKYFSFQLWQEGAARYTEYRIAELAAGGYRPSKEFRNLGDYKSFRTVADETAKNILNELTTLRLENYGRVAFYSLGAGEALLLDRANPKWRKRYFADKFSFDKYFDEAK